MIAIYFYLFPFFLISYGATNDLVGKLSKEENASLRKHCGQEIQSDSMFAALSPRHVIIDVDIASLGEQFKIDECNDNVFEFDNNNWGDTGTILQKYLANTRAWYIGSCDSETLRGFILFEHNLKNELVGSPLCLPDAALEEGDFLDLHAKRSAGKTVENTKTIPRTQLCSKNTENIFCANIYDPNFVGPLVNPWNDRKFYLGHAYDVERTNQILPIYQYRQQICNLSGICGLNFGKTDSENEVNGFTAVQEDHDHSNEQKTNVTFVTSNDNNDWRKISSSAEIIYFAIDEEEGSANVIDYDALEYTDGFVPSFLSAPSEEIVPIPSPETTIVESVSEPLSAVIIPLPDARINAKMPAEFSLITEILVSALVLISLFFFVCLCVYGCVQYKGKPLCGEVSEDNSPA